MCSGHPGPPLPDGNERTAFTCVVEFIERNGLGGTDASVIALAERLGTPRVMTLDRRHFGEVCPRHFDALLLSP